MITVRYLCSYVHTIIELNTCNQNYQDIVCYRTLRFITFFSPQWATLLATIYICVLKIEAVRPVRLNTITESLKGTHNDSFFTASYTLVIVRIHK